VDGVDGAKAVTPVAEMRKASASFMIGGGRYGDVMKG
jgi:hypothetical protein